MENRSRFRSVGLQRTGLFRGSSSLVQDSVDLSFQVLYGYFGRDPKKLRVWQQLRPRGAKEIHTWRTYILNEHGMGLVAHQSRQEVGGCLLFDRHHMPLVADLFADDLMVSVFLLLRNVIGYIIPLFNFT